MLIPVHWFLLPIVLLLSAVFAAGEAALFSLSRLQLESLKATRPGVYRRVRALIHQPEVLLSTVVIANESLNILTGTLVASLVELSRPGMDIRWTAAISIAITMALLLLVSEILPKTLAFRSPMAIATTVVYPLGWVANTLSPLRRGLVGLSESITRILGLPSPQASPIGETDLRLLIEAGEESGSLDKTERDLLLNVFELGDMTVTAIMTPWEKVFTLPENLTVEQVLAALPDRPFSRIPIIVPSAGDVAGVLFAKEMVRLLAAPEKIQKSDIPRRAIMAPYVVSVHKKIAQLFKEFKRNKVHFSLVVDEYGRQLGIVTMEDIINTLLRTGRHPDKPTEAPRRSATG